MSAPQQSLSPEFASGVREVMLMGLTREIETTKKVLAAVLDGNRGYRPDPRTLAGLV
jgi:hypothetical protein